VVLEDENPWTSLVLVPASGEVSFHCGSESRVHISCGTGTCKYTFSYKCSFFYTLKASLSKMVGGGAIWLQYLDKGMSGLLKSPIFFTGRKLIMASVIHYAYSVYKFEKFLFLILCLYFEMAMLLLLIKIVNIFMSTY
jgi:hypothetical protein